METTIVPPTLGCRVTCWCDLRHKLVCVLFLALVVGFIGCGPAGPRKYPVRGTVTFDGQPLEEGHIIFTPEDPSLSPEAGDIVQGEYRLQAHGGMQKVKVSASKEVPGTEGQGFRGLPLIEEYIPAKYNSATTLSAEVTPSGDNRFDFQLEPE